MKKCSPILLVYLPSIILFVISFQYVDPYHHLDRRITSSSHEHSFQRTKISHFKSRSNLQFRRYLVFGFDCQAFPNLYKFVYSSAEASQCLAIGSSDSNVAPNFSFNPFDDAVLLLGIMALSLLLKRMPVVENSEVRSEEYFSKANNETQEDGLSTCPICRGSRLYQNRNCEACQGTGFIAKFGLPPKGGIDKLEPWDADEL